MKILIAGGGIAGLAIAWRLSCAGLPVAIVERGLCGRGASWAAAGMIAPGGELADETDTLTEFGRQSRQAWPEFASEIEKASGADIGYRETGSLFVAETEAQAHSLRGRAKPGQWLSRDELLICEPSLSPKLHGALRFPDDAQVDNRALCEALLTAVIANDVEVRENCEVCSVVITGGQVRALLTESGVMEADKIVLACGAWNSLIAGDLGLPSVKPVKGQMIAWLPPGGITLPTALIWSETVYLVPRHDRLLIGATVEDAGFDLGVERRAGEHLLRMAARLVPSVPKGTLAEIWAGLRPQVADEAPVLGETAIPGLYVAGGQFRNGILFAPAVADFMSAVLRGDNPGELAPAFSPLRFSQAPGG
jgi:glycine oxidase